MCTLQAVIELLISSHADTDGHLQNKEAFHAQAGGIMDTAIPTSSSTGKASNAKA